MLCNLLTEKVVVGLPLSIVWRNTLEEIENMVLNDNPGIIGDEWEWCPLQRLNSVPRPILEIQTTPALRHPVLTSAVKSIVVLSILGETETFNSVIDETTYETDFRLVNLLHAENGNLTHKNLNASIDEPDNWWNVHFVSSDALQSSAILSSNSQHSYWSWRVGIVNESHQYKMKNSVGWRNPMKATTGFKLQVTATPGFHWLYDQCYQMTWLFSGAPGDPGVDSVMQNDGTEALYSAVKSVVLAIRTEDRKAQQHATHWMIQVTKPWTISGWSDSILAYVELFVRVPKYNAHRIAPQWTVEAQSELKTPVERYTSQGASGVWGVHTWGLAWFPLVLGDTKVPNDISGQWYDNWPLDTWADSPIFWSLRDPFLWFLVNAPAEYPEPDKDEASNEVLLRNPECNKFPLPCAPPPQKVVLFCPLPCPVYDLKWWLTKYFADHLDIFYMYAEMENDEHTEM